ncbi:MAG: 4-hydroxybenzoate polyprenyltransferase/phosphoserine phosphatase [Paracoccaceae bacterium]|jgi:4-hydroxybenzoate polyprenyltransferase/phosphoserine phosphatase
MKTTLRKKPLAVDLDGTLVHTNMLLENIISTVVRAPLKFCLALMALKRGKAAFKAFLAQNLEFDPEVLPYNGALLDRLRQENDRDLILCTASDKVIASKIAEHLGIFKDVMASDGQVNLAQKKKADALVARFGPRGFDYVGNSADDLLVWAEADRAWVANATGRVLARAKAQGNVDRVFPVQENTLKTWLKALRVHQWIKNILVFLPLAAAHEFSDTSLLFYTFIGFFVFSLTASGVYVVNDLIDLSADRSHPTKRLRAFAAGRIGIITGIFLAIMLFGTGLYLGTFLQAQFLFWLLIYIFLTTIYSLWLKRLVLFDCFALASLYTIRIMAGGGLLVQSVSLWLICISLFSFMSLAFVKRYAELLENKSIGKGNLKGRGYHVTDGPIIMILGIASGYAAAVIMGLYINSAVVRQMYNSPEIIALTIPVLCFWNSWIWLKASRGEMHEDPVMFAIKDRLSLFCGAIFGAILIIGATL